MTNAVTPETQFRSGNIPLRNKFDALHGAFWQGGYLLHVPKGVVVEIPLRTLSRCPSRSVQICRIHLLLPTLKARSQFWRNKLRRMLTLPGSTVALSKSSLDEMPMWPMCKCSDGISGFGTFSTQRAVVGRDAQFCWVTGMLGSRLSKLNQVAAMEGTGSRVEMLGLTFTHGRQHIDVSTAQEHIAPHTSSDLLYRTVLRDRSQTAWSGNIYVYPEGQHTDAYQKNDNLVLSERSHADTLPGLEIQAHEVRCTHGATAGTD